MKTEDVELWGGIETTVVRDTASDFVKVRIHDRLTGYKMRTVISVKPLHLLEYRIKTAKDGLMDLALLRRRMRRALDEKPSHPDTIFSPHGELWGYREVNEYE